MDNVEFMGQLTSIYVLEVTERFLGNENLDFFYATCQKDAGMPLDECHTQHGSGALEIGGQFARETIPLLNETSSGLSF